MQHPEIAPGTRIAAGHPASEIRLAAARDVDRELRRDLYCRTRAGEFTQLGLPPAQLRALLSQQFELQERDYRERFPRADLDTVQCRGAWIGRFYVDRTADPLRLLDIALVPEWRALGIGGALVGSLLAEADRRDRAVVLHVDRGNPAARLYARLGFRVAGEDGPSTRMVREPQTSGSAAFS